MNPFKMVRWSLDRDFLHYFIYFDAEFDEDEPFLVGPTIFLDSYLKPKSICIRPRTIDSWEEWLLGLMNPVKFYYECDPIVPELPDDGGILLV